VNTPALKLPVCGYRKIPSQELLEVKTPPPAKPLTELPVL